MKGKLALLLIGCFIGILVLASGCVQPHQTIACPADAKQCPDGSYVVRVSPGCEFAPCPEINCSVFSIEDCPTSCVICPPCEVCSSIGCQNEEFCTRIGFNRSWWENVRPKPCQCPEGYVQEGDICNPKCYYSTPKCLMPSIQCNATNNKEGTYFLNIR